MQKQRTLASLPQNKSLYSNGISTANGPLRQNLTVTKMSFITFDEQFYINVHLYLCDINSWDDFSLYMRFIVPQMRDVSLIWGDYFPNGCTTKSRLISWWSISLTTLNAKSEVNYVQTVFMEIIYCFFDIFCGLFANIVNIVKLLILPRTRSH